MEGFSYYLDLSNPYIGTSQEQVRNKKNKKNWDSLVLYFLQSADLLIVKYWPGDVYVSEEFQVSTKGQKLLEPYKIYDKSIELGMRSSYYRIHNSLKSIILETNSQGVPTNIFDFQLLRNNKVLMHSLDNGSSLFFNGNKKDLDCLLKSINKNAICSLS
ncbi:hypothetical protein [Alkalihalobacillus pseudalcaliphilus]|uniref:hypothetical protein n=1 Tax=Alkalihalobacillus pseudalcaliphilus TaxID=79884 RepID=UPI00064DF538|nr:hypothetical protein [Alkalihalobacillus pseudalcaliphilus]KMK76329.1 hypothetical protein AB990_14080 [Alkalihalobacillus pseudalcaliphilus]